MLRARIQRHLAAAGLSLVTGTAAIGIAVVGVGPLGEVAASVRGAGVSLGRSVLSVVVPDAQQTPAEPPAQSSPRPDDGGMAQPLQPAAKRPAKQAPAPAPAVKDTTPQRDREQTDLPVPPITRSPETNPVADVDELVVAPAPQTQASQAAEPEAPRLPASAPDAEGLAGDTLR